MFFQKGEKGETMPYEIAEEIRNQKKINQPTTDKDKPPELKEINLDELCKGFSKIIKLLGEKIREEENKGEEYVP